MRDEERRGTWGILEATFREGLRADWDDAFGTLDQALRAIIMPIGVDLIDRKAFRKAVVALMRLLSSRRCGSRSSTANTSR